MTTNAQQTKCLTTSSFIWLDNVVHDTLENIDIQERLCMLIRDLKVFQSSDKCIEYIKSLPNERFILVIRSRLGQKIISNIHCFTQVYSIYIYGTDKEKNKRWIKRYPKIKGFLDKLDEVIAQLVSCQELSQQQNINEKLSITFFLKKDENTELNDQFIYSQILNDYLLHIKPISNNWKEFLAICKDTYKNDENELRIIREFENEYTPNRALWWYTRKTFAYHLLQKAFHTHNIELLLIFQSFIQDIQRLIEDNKWMKPLLVYKSYMMKNEELQIFKNSIGEYISMNGFFVADLSLQQSKSNFLNVDSTPDCERVLFEISIDPYIDPRKPYCNITSFSYFSNEEEIIFTLGSIFRLSNIFQTHDKKNPIWVIRMKLSTDKHKRLKFVYENKVNQYNMGQINLLSLGRALRKMNKLDDAEKFYQHVLKDIPNDHPNAADGYYGLGMLLDEKKDYPSSLACHQIAMEIKERTLKINDPSIGYSYNCIGNVFQKNGDFKRALEYYEKALSVWKRIYGENHPDTAMCLNNIACVYENEKKYSEALEFHQKALAIKKLHLQDDDPNLSVTHNNLATLYAHTGQLDLAFEHFNISLKIKLKSLPKKHLDISLAYRNIGLVYEMKGDLAQAKSSFEKAAALHHEILPPAHNDIVQIEKDIARVSVQSE